MKFNVSVSRKAQKQIQKIQIQDREKIYAGISNLRDSETWGDVRRLVNHKYDYRLRVGNYRVLFNATEDSTISINEISVEEVKKRDDGTYKNRR